MIAGKQEMRRFKLITGIMSRKERVGVLKLYIHGCPQTERSVTVSQSDRRDSGSQEVQRATGWSPDEDDGLWRTPTETFSSKKQMRKAKGQYSSLSSACV